MKRTCKQCGREFELTESEIEWYKSKNLQLPKRCEECRAENRSRKDEKPEAGTGTASASGAKTITGKVIGAIVAGVVAASVGIGAFVSGTSPQQEPASTTAASVQASQSTQPSANGAVSQQNQSASDYKFRTKKQLKEHFEKHGAEMGFADADAYVAGANAVIGNPATLHKTQQRDGDGDTVYYLESTDELVIVSSDGYIRTYFNPGGIDYYNKQ